MEIILTNKNSELLFFEGYAYIKHRTLADNSLSWRCAQSSCNGRVRTKEDSVEIVKITATSPIQLTSKNVSSEKHLKIEQQSLM